MKHTQNFQFKKKELIVLEEKNYLIAYYYYIKINGEYDGLDSDDNLSISWVNLSLYPDFTIFTNRSCTLLVSLLFLCAAAFYYILLLAAMKF